MFDRLQATLLLSGVFLAPFAGCLPAQEGPEGSSPTESPQIQALSMAVTASPCFENQCTYRLGVESPATLVLVDGEGEERFYVDGAEVQEILALVEGSVSETGVIGNCSGVADVDAVLAVQVDTQPGTVNCETLPRANYDEIVARLVALRNENLACPDWQAPPGYTMATSPLPQRALCWFCYGNCLPEAP